MSEYTMKVGPVTAVFDDDFNWSLTAPESVDAEMVDGLGKVLTLETAEMREINPEVDKGHSLQWLIFRSLAEELATEWDELQHNRSSDGILKDLYAKYGEQLMDHVDKHMEGQHDQSSHGRRGGGSVTPWSDWLEDDAVKEMSEDLYGFTIGQRQFTAVLSGHPGWTKDRDGNPRFWNEDIGKGLDDAAFEYSFRDDERSFEMTGRGEAMEAMRKASVVVMTKLAKDKPPLVTFSAAGDSRVKLYEFLTRRIGKLNDGYTGVIYGDRKPFGSILPGKPDSVREFGIVRNDLLDKARPYVEEVLETKDEIVFDDAFWDELERQILKIIQ